MGLLREVMGDLCIRGYGGALNMHKRMQKNVRPYVDTVFEW